MPFRVPIRLYGEDGWRRLNLWLEIQVEIQRYEPRATAARRSHNSNGAGHTIDTATPSVAILREDEGYVSCSSALVREEGDANRAGVAPRKPPTSTLARVVESRLRGNDGVRE